MKEAWLAEMGTMKLDARKEYSKVVRERYWKAHSKKEKSHILDEYCANTGHARKEAVRKLKCPKLDRGLLGQPRATKQSRWGGAPPRGWPPSSGRRGISVNVGRGL